jgi:hypothetical protein
LFACDTGKVDWIAKNKTPTKAGVLFFLVGGAGFEPATLAV